MRIRRGLSESHEPASMFRVADGRRKEKTAAGVSTHPSHECAMPLEPGSSLADTTPSGHHHARRGDHNRRSVSNRLYATAERRVLVNVDQRVTSLGARAPIRT